MNNHQLNCEKLYRIDGKNRLYGITTRTQIESGNVELSDCLLLLDSVKTDIDDALPKLKARRWELEILRDPILQAYLVPIPPKWHEFVDYPDMLAQIFLHYPREQIELEASDTIAVAESRDPRLLHKYRSFARCASRGEPDLYYFLRDEATER